MRTMLFQGLNFMEGSVFGITLQKILELLSWNVIAMTQGINFVGIIKIKLAFCMGKLRVKWLKMGISAAHTCTIYYRQCLPWESMSLCSSHHQPETAQQVFPRLPLVSNFASCPLHTFPSVLDHWWWCLPSTWFQDANWAGVAHLRYAFFPLGSVFLLSEEAVCVRWMDRLYAVSTAWDSA